MSECPTCHGDEYMLYPCYPCPTCKPPTICPTCIAEACSTTSPQHPPTIRANAVESLIADPSHAESMDGSSAL